MSSLPTAACGGARGEGAGVVFTGRRQAAWEEFDVPERPGPFEVVVETTWSAVSVGTELAIYTGAHIG